jgi:fused signal recognition particle receptor
MSFWRRLVGGADEASRVPAEFPAQEAPPRDGPVAAEAASPEEPAAPEEPSGDATPSLDAGLARSRMGFVARLRGVLGGRIDEETWGELEEALIGGDLGAVLAARVVERARRRAGDLPGDPRERATVAVRDELAAHLLPRDPAWSPHAAGLAGPSVILVVGVNGTGKTTTIGKLAARFVAEGRPTLLAAADTFRAAAIDQLRVWADRAGAAVVAHAPGADPGAVVFDALDAAVARGVQVVIVDTAGRLHTKVNLMEELAKIRRVIDRRLPGTVPEVLFVIDATTGQNGLAQAKAFHDSVGLTGVVLTKLDSTSKGGIVFAIEEQLGVPVRYVGVGEHLDDLIPFDPAAFVNALFG